MGYAAVGGGWPFRVCTTVDGVAVCPAFASAAPAGKLVISEILRLDIEGVLEDDSFPMSMSRSVSLLDRRAAEGRCLLRNAARHGRPFAEHGLENGWATWQEERKKGQNKKERKKDCEGQKSRATLSVNQYVCESAYMAGKGEETTVILAAATQAAVYRREQHH